MAFDAYMYFPGQSRVQGETHDEAMAAFREKRDPVYKSR